MSKPGQPIPSLSQPKPGEQWKRAQTPWEDPEFLSSYPNLFAYMTQERWESGTVRQTATLTVFADTGALTVILNDRANGRSLFVQEGSLFSALVKIETDLAEGTADWRIKRNSQNPFDTKVPF